MLFRDLLFKIFIMAQKNSCLMNFHASVVSQWVTSSLKEKGIHPQNQRWASLRTRREDSEEGLSSDRDVTLAF